MKEEIEKLIYDAIYKWVAKNFGESEAEDPSWSIEALAHDLTNAQLIFDIYKIIEYEYLRDDCDMVAEGMEIKLTDEERDAVVDEFMDSEAYVDAHVEDWQWFINRELVQRKEK